MMHLAMVLGVLYLVIGRQDSFVPLQSLPFHFHIMLYLELAYERRGQIKAMGISGSSYTQGSGFGIWSVESCLTYDDEACVISPSRREIECDG